MEKNSLLKTIKIMGKEIRTCIINPMKHNKGVRDAGTEGANQDRTGARSSSRVSRESDGREA